MSDFIKVTGCWRLTKEELDYLGSSRRCKKCKHSEVFHPTDKFDDNYCLVPDCSCSFTIPFLKPCSEYFEAYD